MTLLSVRNSFLDHLINFLKKRLPDRTKRLVFLASLTARLKDSEIFDIATLKKLNRVMALASSDAAIELPVCLSHAIWHGKSAYNILSIDNTNANELVIDNKNIERMSLSVISIMPQWLLYGEQKAIRQDVEQLLNNYNSIVTI